jgi:ABC-2 type transport system permease protein
LTAQDLAGNHRLDYPFSRNSAIALIRTDLQQSLVYRFDLVIGLIKTFILIFIFRSLWTALYGGSSTFAGVTIAQTLTYATISMVISPLFPNSLIQEVGARIRTGDILFDLSRPIYYGSLLLYKMAGEGLTALLTSTIPACIIVSLFPEMAWPISPLVWISFGLSLCLGFITAFLIDFTFALSGFWFTETWGIFYAKWSLTDVFGGKFLPLWIFPPLLEKIALYLPFRGITYTPVAILVGEIGLEQVPLQIGFQIAWIILLAGLSWVIYHLAIRKFAIQGG